MVKEHRAVGNFDTIVVEGNLNVYIHQAMESAIAIEAGENLIPLIETSILNRTLRVRNNNTCNFVRGYEQPINVIIFVPDPKYVRLNGTGNIYSGNTITTDTIKIDNRGMGDINLDLNVKTAYIHIHGGGDINLKGKAIYTEIYGKGTCHIRCGELITDFSYIFSATTGNMYIHTNKDLGAEITHYGNIYYTGNPNINYEKISAQGRLIKK